MTETEGERRWIRLASVASLGVVVAACFWLWRPLADVYYITSDDFEYILISQGMAAGNWKLLVEPQSIHLLPLYRLVRLYFDLHVPSAYHWMHLIALSAHAASTILLFTLSRRVLGPTAALAAAVLFAWQTVSADAIVIKSQNPFVLSLPFILAALVCLLQVDQGGRMWFIGSLSCLLVAVGLHSVGAMAAIPGVLLGYYLMAGRERRDRSRGDVAACVVCAIPLVVGGAGWFLWSVPGVNMNDEFEGLPRSAQEVAGRFWSVLYRSVLHFGFVARQTTPSPLFLVIATGAFVTVLYLSRRQRAARRRWRWLPARHSLHSRFAAMRRTTRRVGRIRLSRRWRLRGVSPST